MRVAQLWRKKMKIIVQTGRPPLNVYDTLSTSMDVYGELEHEEFTQRGRGRRFFAS